MGRITDYLFRSTPGTEVAVRTPAEVVEHRDPTAATRSLRYVTPGRAQAPDWDAAQAFRLANNTVLTCVDRVGSYLSECPFRVGADPEKPDDFDPRAPLARLLSPPPGGPNPVTSARRFWKWTVGQRMMAGRFGWELELGTNDLPVAMWALPASSLVPIPSTSGVQYFDRFEYGRAGDKRTLPRERVLYDWIPSADDWRQPDPPLRAANLDLLVAVCQSHYDYAFLKNDARPATVVITEEFEDEVSKQAWQDQWNASYRGPDNAGRVMFAESTGDDGPKGAVEVVVVGTTPKDAQADQRYRFRLEQIAAALGVPWSILDASGRTFDNASQEWQNFLTGTIEPLACDLADAINMQLAPRFGSLVGWFDLSRLGGEQRVDPVTASVGAPTMVQAQLMTINEARADYGLPPVPDGDRMMTADEIAALRGSGTGVAAPTPVRETARVVPVEAPHARAVEPPVPIPEPVTETAEEAEQRRTKIWTTTDAAVRNLERAWEKAFTRLFNRQAKSVLGRLGHKRARRTGSEVRALTDEVFDPEFWIAETLDEARTLYSNVVDSAGQKMAGVFGIAFDLDAPFVADFVDARANQLAGQVTETTYQAIKDALAAGIAEGEGIPELSSRITHVFDVASQSRATTIARTEVISAYNGAGQEVAASYGTDVVAGQEWIATRDSRVREQHAERDGERVAIGEPFSGGLAYPGDPAGDAADTINCRCTVAYLTPDEFSERMVPAGIARAVLALVKRGEFDERHVRSVLRVA